MRKLLSLVMVLAMMSNTAFATSTHNQDSINNDKIAKVFDGFRYQMTVAVNPSDVNYQAKAFATFKKSMAKLQSEGVTTQEILNYTRMSLLDNATRSDFDRLMLSINPEKTTSDEAGKIAMTFMAKKYQQGASYSGGGKATMKTAMIIISVVIVGVVTYLVIKHVKEAKAKTVTNTATETKTETKTDTETKVNTETVTNVTTNTETVTNVTTNTETVTSTETINNTETIINTETLVTTNTVTNTLTNTVTDTVTNTYTYTDTFTYTDTNTNTQYGYCCSMNYNPYNPYNPYDPYNPYNSMGRPAYNGPMSCMPYEYFSSMPYCYMPM